MTETIAPTTIADTNATVGPTGGSQMSPANRAPTSHVNWNAIKPMPTPIPQAEIRSARLDD